MKIYIAWADWECKGDEEMIGVYAKKEDAEIAGESYKAVNGCPYVYVNEEEVQ